MTRRTRVALALVLLLALGLRLWRLDHKSLWLDEAWTWAHTQKPFRDCITSEFSNPPGSFAIFWASVRALGDDERGLRFPSALSGVLATWLLFRLARRLFDAPTALVAALLYAASAFHLLFTQEARTFGFLSCAVLASTEAVVLLLEGATLGRAAYYVLSAAAGLYLHYVFGFVILAQNGVVAWSWWVRREKGLSFRWWAVAQLATALLFVPWFLWMIGHMGRVDTSYLDMPLGRVGAAFFAFTWGHRAFPAGSGRPLLERVLEHGPLIAGFLVVVLPLVLRGSRASARLPRAGAVIGWVFLAPMLLAIALAMAGSVRFTNHRYLSFLCPFWILLMVAGMRSITNAAWRNVAHGLVAVVWVASLVHYYGVAEIANENWRDAARTIAERRGPGDLVCVYKPYIDVAYRYYDRSSAEVLKLPEDMSPDAFHNQLASAVRGRPRVWLLLGHHFGEDGDVWPQALKRLGLQPCCPPRRFPHPDGDVVLWELVHR